MASNQMLLITDAVLRAFVSSKHITLHVVTFLIESSCLWHSNACLNFESHELLLLGSAFQSLQYERSNRRRSCSLCLARTSPRRYNIHPLHLRLPSQSLTRERSQTSTSYRLIPVISNEENRYVGRAGRYSRSNGAKVVDLQLLRLA